MSQDLIPGYTAEELEAMSADEIRHQIAKLDAELADAAETYQRTLAVHPHIIGFLSTVLALRYHDEAKTPATPVEGAVVSGPEFRFIDLLASAQQSVARHDDRPDHPVSITFDVPADRVHEFNALAATAKAQSAAS